MFKVGDEVVCVDAMPMPTSCIPLGLERGAEYVVTGAGIFDGQMYVGLKGLSTPGNIDYFAWRFVKLPKLTVDQEDEVTA